MSDAFQNGAFQGGAFQIGGSVTSSGSPYTLTITSAAITLTGSSVNLKRGLQLSITTAAVTLTGSSVNLKRGLKITTGTAAVTTTGTSVTLKVGRKISVTSTAVTLSGTSVAMRSARQIAISPSAINVTGSSVDLNYSGPAVATTPTGTNFGFGYSDVQSIDDTRWKGVKAAREQAREAVEALGKPKQQKARKEAVKEAIKAVERTTVAVERYVEAPRSSPTLPDLSGVLDSLGSLEEMLRMYAEADRIRQADIEMARQRWIEVERQIAYEAFLEEELMVVMALAL